MVPPSTPDRAGADGQLPLSASSSRTLVPCSREDRPRIVGIEDKRFLRRSIAQGKPVARRGRKARDLPSNGDRPVAEDPTHSTDSKESNVKGNLVRLTMAMALVASLALTIGAGLRWY